MKNYLEPVPRKRRVNALATLLLSLAATPAFAQASSPAAAEPAAGASDAAAPHNRPPMLPRPLPPASGNARTCSATWAACATCSAITASR